MSDMALTEQQIEVVAKILRCLGEIKDWRQRIDVAAAAIKIGIMENPGQNWWVDQVRQASGIEERSTP